jgi:hypothetical protein
MRSFINRHRPTRNRVVEEEEGLTRPIVEEEEEEGLNDNISTYNCNDNTKRPVVSFLSPSSNSSHQL